MFNKSEPVDIIGAGIVYPSFLKSLLSDRLNTATTMKIFDGATSWNP